MKLISITFEVSQLEMSGKYDNDLINENILFILVTFDVFHFNIFGIYNIDLQL